MNKTIPYNLTIKVPKEIKSRETFLDQQYVNSKI